SLRSSPSKMYTNSRGRGSGGGEASSVKTESNVTTIEVVDDRQVDSTEAVEKSKIDQSQESVVPQVDPESESKGKNITTIKKEEKDEDSTKSSKESICSIASTASKMVVKVGSQIRSRTISNSSLVSSSRSITPYPLASQ